MNLKPLVNDPLLWKSFLEWVDGAIEKSHLNLEKLTEPAGIYREQGKIDGLRRLKRLREEVNGADQPSLLK